MEFNVPVVSFLHDSNIDFKDHFLTFQFCPVFKVFTKHVYVNTFPWTLVRGHVGVHFVFFIPCTVDN